MLRAIASRGFAGFALYLLFKVCERVLVEHLASFCKE
jgi:hypothetical protein